jgi:hypothetical protein
VHATTWYAAAEQCHAASYLQDIISLASGVYAEPKLAMTLETSGVDQERETRILMLGYNATLLFRMLAPARGEPVHDMRLDPGSPADLASRWEIGLVALPASLEEDPEGDPVALLVVNEGGIAHSEVLADEPDAAELARFVAGEVTHCTTQLGAPPLIWCDDDLLLGALAVLPALAHCRVMLMERLPLLEIAEHDLTESLLSEARDAKKSKSGPGEKIRRPRKKRS